jgi:cytochrome c551
MKKSFACLILLLAFSLAACGKSNTTTPSATPETGAGTATATDNRGATTVDAQSIYKQNCMSCHGNNMEGAIGPNLQKVGAKYNKDQIVTILTNGRGAMPSFKNKLSSDEIVSLADWLSAKK